jgi:Spy/CpxP family protein refolding chaperone
MFARKLISSVAFASLFALAIPTVAFADETAADGRGEAGREHGKAKGHDKAFPMPAAKFTEHVEKRIARVRERIAERLEKGGATPEKTREVMAKVDAGTAKVRAAAEEATKDGVVTKGEAMKVRQVARELRPNAGKGKGKAKGRQ